MSLSEAEWVLIRDGAEAGVRCDGRGAEDYRPMRLESGLLSHAEGSARLRLGATDVLVGVKAKLETPAPPNVGSVRFFVDCSANARPEFEGRGGEETAAALGDALTAAYAHPSALPYTQLCLKEGAFAWTLYVDIVLLEMGGNLYDAASLAVKAALWKLRLPVVSVLYNEEKEEHDVELGEETSGLVRLELEEQAPILLTVAKMGTANVLDPTEEEGLVSRSALIVGVLGSSGESVLVQQEGSASLHPDSVAEMLALGLKCGAQLNQALVHKLREEEAQGEQKDILGFLAD